MFSSNLLLSLGSLLGSITPNLNCVSQQSHPPMDFFLGGLWATCLAFIDGVDGLV